MADEEKLSDREIQLKRYIKTAYTLSEKGTFTWWSDLAGLLKELQELRGKE